MTVSAVTLTHTYRIPWHFTVTLSVSGSGGSDTATRSDYIVIGGWRYRFGVAMIRKDAPASQSRGQFQAFGWFDAIFESLCRLLGT